MQIMMFIPAFNFALPGIVKPIFSAILSVVTFDIPKVNLNDIAGKYFTFSPNNTMFNESENPDIQI